MKLFQIILTLIAIVMLSVTALTVLWLCFRAITPEGETPPRWGDVRPLKRLSSRGFFIFRMIAAAMLAGLMTLPMAFISDLVDERLQRSIEVISEITGLWGGVQIFSGPVISVPYTVRSIETEQIPLSEAELSAERSMGSDRVSRDVIKTVESRHTALILPEALVIEGDISTELRSRSIYSTRVYTANLSVSGKFLKPDLTGQRRNISEIHWDKAVAAVSMSSTKAIRDITGLEIAGQTLKFLPGNAGNKAFSTGFSGECDLSAIAEGESLPFKFQVSVGGAGSLFLTPVGVSNRFCLESAWPHPNFTGSGLPASHDITPKGFSAVWEIPNLVRNYPQVSDMDYWVDYYTGASGYSDGYETPPEDYDSSKYALREYVAGIEFFEPVSHYSLLSRGVKYAALFILLTFLALAIFENFLTQMSGVRLNIVQYCVIGMGLALFYLTLLAVSEHLSFGRAYLLSAAINIAMTGGYVLGALKLLKPAAFTVLAQGLLYAMLFFILRMEDYALLAGSALLLLATAALMFTTRNINQPQNRGLVDVSDGTS
jgi:inner membrane protein